MNPTNIPHVFNHYMPKGLPSATFALELSRSVPGDLDLVERLAIAYRRSQSDQANMSECGWAEDMWDHVKDKHYKHIESLLLNFKLQELAELLCNGIRSEAAFGLGSGPGWLQRSLGREQQTVVAPIIIDRLVACAEALGVIPVENPESSPWGENIYRDINELCCQIERMVGIDIGTPLVFGLFGIKAGNRLITVRTPDAIYTAANIRRLLGITSGTSGHVLEIGGGFGCCAYYASQLGVKSYEIIDLPIVNVLQGYFLGRALGPENVKLYGEETSRQKVSIQPNWILADYPAKSIDLVFSHDVFPELHPVRSANYLADIYRVGKGMFYTINHDGSYRVDGYSVSTNRQISRRFFDLMAEFEKFRLLIRSHYWIRKGYIEEIYRF